MFHKSKKSIVNNKMRRKTTFLLSLLLTIALGVSAQTSEPRHEILLQTDSGNVRIPPGGLFNS